jgi:hypothetical protein
MRIKVTTILMGVWLMTYSVQAASRASLLPRDADVLVRVSDTSLLAGAMKTTSFGRLWNDTTFQAALGEYDIEDAIKQSMFSDTPEEEYHLMEEEVKMLKGEIAFSYNVIKEEYALVAAVSEEDFKRSLILDTKISALNEENKITVRKSVYQGVDIYAHHYEADKELTSWQTYIDNTLLYGSSEEWIKQTITKIKTSPIQTKEDEVPSIIARVKSAKLMEKLSETIESKTGQDNSSQQNGAMPSFSPAKIFSALGLSNLKELTLSIKFNKDSMVYDTNLLIDKPFKGLLNIYDFTPSSLNTQIPYAPQGTISYDVSRLNLLKFWQALPETITQAVPAMAQQANATIFSMAGMLGVDPGQDIFAHLDTQCTVTSVDSSPEPESIYYIRIKDEVALQSSLERMFNKDGMLRMSLGENFKEEDFRDAHIYEFGSPQTNTTFALTATSGYLAIGSGKIVRQYLRAIASPNPANKAFYNSRLFAELRKETPSKAYSYSAMDVGKYVKVLLMMTENTPGLDAAQNNPMMENNPFPNFDKSKLPSADYMSQFFGYSLGYTVPTDKGIKSKAIIYYGKK